jgi:hypothetical protein
MIFSKGEVDKHLAKEELYFQRTKKQLSCLLEVIADIEKDLRQLRIFAETGLRNEKVNKIVKEIEHWEEKIKIGLSVILQLAGEELTEKEELPRILVDILGFTVRHINWLEKRFGLTQNIKITDAGSFRNGVNDLERQIYSIKYKLNAILHLFNSAAELTLIESKILFRQALGNQYLEEAIPKWVKILTKEFIPLGFVTQLGFNVEFYLENEPEEFIVPRPLPLAYSGYGTLEISTINTEINQIFEEHSLILRFQCQRAVINLIKAGNHRYSIEIKYDSIYDAFSVKIISYSSGNVHFSSGGDEGWFISLDTFFDELISRKDLILTDTNFSTVRFNDDYKKIVSSLKNGIAP